MISNKSSVNEAAPGVWQIVLPWVRAYVLTDGKHFMLVDTGTYWDSHRLLTAVDALQLDPAHCQGVLLTHGHCDHAGGAAFFAQQYGARIHAHLHERPFIETRRTYIPAGFRAFSTSGAMFALGEACWPMRRHKVDVVLAEGDMIGTPAGVWRVIHTPGHTPGHISFFRETDATLLSGDALINIIPVTRQEGLTLPLPLFTSDLKLAHESARRLATLMPRILLPGHGKPLHENTAARVAAFINANAVGS